MQNLILTAALACLSTPAWAFTPQSSDCNDTTRQSDIVAGDHNMSEETCQQITFSVAGQSFKTPDKCRTGGAHYAGTVYKCSGPLVGTHCNPRSWRVAVTTWTGGACPKVPRLDIWSWDAWKKVPKALLKALECVAPAKKEDKDWSATTRTCSSGNQVASLEPGLVYESSAFVPYMAWQGNPTFVLDTPTEWSVFLNDYDFSQSTDPGVLPGLMGHVARAHSNSGGFDLDATVTIEHFAGPGASPFNTYTARIIGLVGTNGMFDIQKNVPIGDITKSCG